MLHASPMNQTCTVSASCLCNPQILLAIYIDHLSLMISVSLMDHMHVAIINSVFGTLAVTLLAAIIHILRTLYEGKK